MSERWQCPRNKRWRESISAPIRRVCNRCGRSQSVRRSRCTPETSSRHFASQASVVRPDGLRASCAIHECPLLGHSAVTAWRHRPNPPTFGLLATQVRCLSRSCRDPPSSARLPPAIPTEVPIAADRARGRSRAHTLLRRQSCPLTSSLTSTFTTRLG